MFFASATAVLAATLSLTLAQQASVPSDLSSSFNPSSITLQILYSDASKTNLHGVIDGSQVSQQETSQTPSFALGDASEVNPSLITMILLVDTTSDSNRALHFLQTDFSSNGDATAISTSKAPLVPYVAPGALGEPSGTRKYTWLLIQQPAGFKPAALKAGNFNVQTFISDNKLQNAIAGLEMVVPVTGNGGGAAVSSSASSTTSSSSSSIAAVTSSTLAAKSTITSVSSSSLSSSTSTTSSSTSTTAAAAASTTITHSTSSSAQSSATRTSSRTSSSPSTSSSASATSVPFISIPAAVDSSTSSSIGSMSSSSSTSSSASNSGAATTSLPPVTLTTFVGASGTATTTGAKSSISAGAASSLGASGIATWAGFAGVVFFFI